jgi:hypothetical protein
MDQGGAAVVRVAGHLQRRAAAGLGGEVNLPVCPLVRADGQVDPRQRSSARVFSDGLSDVDGAYHGGHLLAVAHQREDT